MPGAYAHITLVNLLSETARLRNLPREAASAVQKNFKYCELGAVSPDYPYLALGNQGAKQWANAMHYENTGDMVHAGIEYLRGSTGLARDKGFAWLLGYTAHVTTDVTIHPVVELKVGPYKGNEKAHRICEMHQDTHIYQRLDVGRIGLGDYLDSSIAACGETSDRECLDADIERMWRSILQRVYPTRFTRTPPDINLWHRRFVFIIDQIAEEGHRLLPIARHVAIDAGLTYPEKEDINPGFIWDLAVPDGRKSYDEIFDQATDNVSAIWELVGRGVFGNDREYLASIGHWNLDTGRDENGALVFWS